MHQGFRKISAAVNVGLAIAMLALVVFWPGWRAELSDEDFLRQAREVGMVLVGQSKNLAPADGLLPALQAYRNAISKIGRGTGVRAVRYRQNAREAADKANPAIPCWIMPHYHCYLSGDRLPEEVDIDATDDAMAMLEAERMLADAQCHVMEVWHGTRLVGRLSLSKPAA